MVDATLTQDITQRFRNRRMVAFAVPAVILVYLTYIFFAFELPGLAQRARLDNAAILLSDFWSHKTHVTRDNASGAVTVAIEGEKKGAYPEGTYPEWVTRDGD
ncbi:MAG: phosphonate ABC transporter, permease protein PhnE, partial [Paracoccaceae bacterium]